MKHTNGLLIFGLFAAELALGQTTVVKKAEVGEFFDNTAVSVSASHRYKGNIEAGARKDFRPYDVYTLQAFGSKGKLDIAAYLTGYRGIGETEVAFDDPLYRPELDLIYNLATVGPYSLFAVSELYAPVPDSDGYVLGYLQNILGSTLGLRGGGSISFANKLRLGVMSPTGRYEDSETGTKIVGNTSALRLDNILELVVVPPNTKELTLIAYARLVRDAYRNMELAADEGYIEADGYRSVWLGSYLSGIASYQASADLNLAAELRYYRDDAFRQASAGSRQSGRLTLTYSML
tara:strand:- start:419 stop:1294 length:876 start_codon:yes stop_codon:yes gene_type:complete